MWMLVAVVAFACGAIGLWLVTEWRRRVAECVVVLRFAECKADHRAEMRVADPSRMLPAVQPIVVEQIECPTCFLLSRGWNTERASPERAA